MPFQALGVRVLIASPGDTGSARNTIRSAIEDWNAVHAEDAEVILRPVMWERDATPELGDRPQGIINKQLVDHCDILIGCFWTRLGTPTGEAESGTAEEIERFEKAGKPVLLYFCEAPVMLDSVDLDQYKRLVDFKTNVQERGLAGSYASDEALWRGVNAALTRVVREQFKAAIPEQGEAESPLQARLLARVEREREFKGLTKRGKAQYRNRYEVVIENLGTAMAEDLSFNLQPSGESAEGGISKPAANASVVDQVEASLEVSTPTIVTPGGIASGYSVPRLEAGNSVRYPLLVHMGTVPEFVLVTRWREADQARMETYTLSL